MVCVMVHVVLDVLIFVIHYSLFSIDPIADPPNLPEGRL